MALERGFEDRTRLVPPSVVGELVIARSVMGARIDKATSAGDESLVYDLEIAAVHTDERITEEITNHLRAQGHDVSTD